MAVGSVTLAIAEPLYGELYIVRLILDPCDSRIGVQRDDEQQCKDRKGGLPVYFHLGLSKWT